MAIQRSTIVMGPAIVGFGGAYFYSRGDITLTIPQEFEEIELSLYGKVDEHLVNRHVEISFTPSELNAAAVASINALATKLPGQSLLGSGSDTPVTIQTMAGKLLTVTNGFISKYPGLHLRAKGEIMKPMTITGVQKNNVEWSDTSAIMTVTNNAWSDPATFKIESIMNQRYYGSWAAAGAWSSFGAYEGFEIDWNMTIFNVDPDTTGLIDVRFSKLDVECSCKVIPQTSSAVAESEILAGLSIQGTGAGRGASLNLRSNQHDLVITGTAAAGQAVHQLLTATIKQAALKEGSLVFSLNQLRNGPTKWCATRSITGGVMTPLFSLALT